MSSLASHFFPSSCGSQASSCGGAAASKPLPVLNTKLEPEPEVASYYACGSPTDVALWAFPKANGSSSSEQHHAFGIFQRFFATGH